MSYRNSDERPKKGRFSIVVWSLFTLLVSFTIIEFTPFRLLSITLNNNKGSGPIIVNVVINIIIGKATYMYKSSGEQTPVPATMIPTATLDPAVSRVTSECLKGSCHDLKYSEGNGGHTLSQHVFASSQQVSERAKKSQWYASRFTDFSTAQWAVDQVLHSQVPPKKQANCEWQFTNVDVQQSIGSIWRPDGSLWRDTHYVTMLINPCSEIIETAFPSDPAIPIKY